QRDAGAVDGLDLLQAHPPDAVLVRLDRTPQRGNRLAVDPAVEDQGIALTLHVRVHAAAASVAGLEAAGAEVGGDLGDGAAVERAVELVAVGLHEADALDHHVEDLPLAAVLAHQVVHRDRLATGALQLGRHAHHAAVA